MLIGPERRNEIIAEMKNRNTPISGKSLAQKFQVSRQIIVQDIALIRAAGYDIISTNKGYLLNEPYEVSRIFKVAHTDEELEDELFSILDLGGKVVNVMINHKVYGHMEATLNINSRRKAETFLEDIRTGKSSPLKNITSNYHYHKVVADSEETLNLIEEMLKTKGFFVETVDTDRRE